MKMLKPFLLKLIYPFAKEHYSLKIAATEAEKQEVYKFRYKIYRQQLNHYFLDEQYIRDDVLTDEYDNHKYSITIYASAKNKIIGTVRVTYWHRDELPQALKEQYFLEEEIIKKFYQIGEFRFLQVDPAYKHSLVSFCLLSYVWELLTARSAGETLLLSDCQPGLLHYYLNFGCFLYTSKVVTKKYNILLIPFAFIGLDLKYLKSIHSPFYFIARTGLERFKKAHALAAAKLLQRNFCADIPHLTAYASAAEIKTHRDHLATELMKERFDFLIAILPQVLILSLPKETVIITHDLIDYDIYMNLQGSLGVYHPEDKQIATINAGEIFGEMSILSPKRKRIADVKCLTDCKILLVPRSLLNQLEKKDIKKAKQLLTLLDHSLIEKLTAQNKK